MPLEKEVKMLTLYMKTPLKKYNKSKWKLISLYFSFLWLLKNTFVYIACITYLYVDCFSQSTNGWNTLTTSKGKKTSSGACSDVPSESGAYKLAYSVFDEQSCNSSIILYRVFNRCLLKCSWLSLVLP